jgi:hypothetical protein
MDEPALAIGALGADDIFKQLLEDSESRMGSQMNALMQTGLAVERKQLLKTLKKERELSDRAILGLQAIYRMISSPGRRCTLRMRCWRRRRRCFIFYV